mmetsp:Transcript_18735/g.41059  ORF Transcript_18735/g.41059 Transcript_18735/m.41059 type:complete len:218 (-) Transcript_18735:302-955(-)
MDIAAFAFDLCNCCRKFCFLLKRSTVEDFAEAASAEVLPLELDALLPMTSKPPSRIMKKSLPSSPKVATVVPQGTLNICALAAMSSKTPLKSLESQKARRLGLLRSARSTKARSASLSTVPQDATWSWKLLGAPSIFFMPPCMAGRFGQSSFVLKPACSNMSFDMDKVTSGSGPLAITVATFGRSATSEWPPSQSPSLSSALSCCWPSKLTTAARPE